MKKNHLILAALLAIAPSTLMATPPLDYGDFTLTKSEVNEVIRAANARCPQKSNDYSSTMAKEPLYQAECRSKLVVRSEARLNIAFKRTLSRASKEARNNLRAEQRLWIKNRYDNCERDKDENLGGARKNVLFHDCQLFEIKRRILWIEIPF